MTPLEISITIVLILLAFLTPLEISITIVLILLAFFIMLIFYIISEASKLED